MSFRNEVKRCAALLIVAAVAAPCSAATEDALAWPEATREARPWSYWWWMGSAVDPANLTKEMERYRGAGWGGVHIIPIYGARGFDARSVEYLTPGWMSMLRHAVSEGQRLDLGVDMTTGTGWCFGGPNITDELASAVAEVKTYEVAPGSSPVTKFSRNSIQALVAVSSNGSTIDITDRISPDGSVMWTAEGAGWRLLALTQRPATRVKRAAPGGEGYMLNPFYQPAIEKYLDPFSKAFAVYEGPRPRAMYHDSFEYGANWAPNLIEQFAKRRGYPLTPELPALFGGEENERVARLKSDYRETLSDALLEDFAKVWVQWCHRNGFQTRYQAHGSPANLLDLYAEADIPETEMFNLDRSTVIAKFASSAAHVAGRRLVASETGTWLKEHFTETLGDLKDLVDQLFAAGVNHVIYHGTCYSPDDAPWPGWLFYASTQMNPRNPIWRDVPALNGYIARAQSMLQGGRPDNDVLLYWPVHDIWHNPQGLNLNFSVHSRTWVEEQAFGKLAEQLFRRGFQADFISDRQLQGAAADDSGVRVAGGSYRAVLSPSCHRMPEATFGRLLELARAGATVIFQDRLPADVPGLANLDGRRKDLQRLVASLPLREFSPGVRQARIGQGRVLVGDVERSLFAANVRREPLADWPGVELLRRASGAGWFYFVANRGAQFVDGWAPLSAAADSVVVMDPMTGRTGIAATRKGASGLEVYLQIEPGGSVILRALRGHPPAPSWTYWERAGDAVALNGAWDVKFIEGGPELPEPLRLARLVSWTEAGGDAAKRFARSAVYTLRFEAPVRKTDAWRLDLGRVCESARIRLNGRELATLIAPPFHQIAEGLRPGVNVLEIEVTNVAANRIRDLDRRKAPWKIFHDINFVGIDYKPFDAAGWPLRESGLIGPVVLQPLSKLDPAGAKRRVE